MNRLNVRNLIGALSLAGVALILSSCIGPPDNRAPVATFTATPHEGYAPLHVRLDAGATVDPDGDALTYEWTLGDGTTETGRVIDHTFFEGSYSVTLRVADPGGAMDTASKTVTAREVPDGYIVSHFQWVFEGEDQTWDALLSYDLYQMYRGRIRTPFAGNYEYGDFVLDPLDDPTLEDLALVLWNRVAQSDERFIDMALAFVQGAIAYRVDPPGFEWPFYPMETLVDGVGDCEDTSILLVSLLRARGIACKLAFVDTDEDRTPDHVLSLIAVPANGLSEPHCTGGQVTILTFDEQAFAVAETAVDHSLYGVGCDPWGLTSDDVLRTWSF